MKNHNGVEAQSGFLFEVNPLILQIVLWSEAEILDARPEFLALGQATRVAEICKQLFFNDVAEVDSQSPPIWIPTNRIESDCGRSNIVPCSRYELVASISTEEGRKFKKVIGSQFRRRLRFVVKKCVLAFESYNLGLTKTNVCDVGSILTKQIKKGLSV